MPHIALKAKPNLQRNRNSESADSLSSNNSNKTVQSIMFSQYKKRANDDTSQTPKAKSDEVSQMISSMDQETKSLLKSEFAKTHSRYKDAERIKKILMKGKVERSELEIDELVAFFNKDISFFKERTNLSQ